MSTLQRHEPPGNLNDLNEENKDRWSKDYISYWMNGEITADPKVVGDGRTPLTQFFDGTKTPFDTTQKPTPVEWNAFPKLIKDSFPGEPLRWQIADSSRAVQDEYLEWSVSRGQRKYTGDIESVTFTCEGPEYWQFFASYQRQDFLNKVKELNSDFSSDMSDKDFFLKDANTGHEVYNPANQWNLLSTTGTISHLIQPNNTLSAEVDIAAQATVIRKDANEKIIRDADALIKCSKYGNPGRNSDPLIGVSINRICQGDAAISVADPVGLYIRKFDITNFKMDINSTDDSTTPKEEDLKPIEKPEEVFHWQRGDIKTGHGLRIQIKVPEGRKGKNNQQLLVSNIYDTAKGRHIKFGAQFADYFTIGVNAVGKEGKEAAAQYCFQPPTEKAVPCQQFEGFPRPNVNSLGSSRG